MSAGLLNSIIAVFTLGGLAWFLYRPRVQASAAYKATFSGSAAVRTAGIGEDTALVMERIAGLPEPPEPQSDEALAELGRVLIEITVDRVSAKSHL